MSVPNKISMFSGCRPGPTGGCPPGGRWRAELDEAERGDSLHAGGAHCPERTCQPDTGPAKGQWEGPASRGDPEWPPCVPMLAKRRGTLRVIRGRPLSQVSGQSCRGGGPPPRPAPRSGPDAHPLALREEEGPGGGAFPYSTATCCAAPSAMFLLSWTPPPGGDFLRLRNNNTATAAATAATTTPIRR